MADSEIVRVVETLGTTLSPNTRLDSVVRLRRILAKDCPPINSVTQAGAVPLLIQCLGLSSEPKLQFEACWAICNILSGSSLHVRIVLENGALRHLISLAQQLVDLELKDLAIWALANIAGDQEETRNVLLTTTPVMEIVAQILEQDDDFVKAHSVLITHTSWLFANLLKGCSDTPPVVLHMLLVNLQRYGRRFSTFPKVVSNLCWALRYQTSDTVPDTVVQMICDDHTQVLAILLDLFALPWKDETYANVFIPTLGILASLCASPQTCVSRKLVQAGCLQVMRLHLTSADEDTSGYIVKEFMWMLSNLCATPELGWEIHESRIFNAVLRLEASWNPLCRKQALLAMTNVLGTAATSRNESLLKVYRDEYDLFRRICGLVLNATNKHFMNMLPFVLQTQLIENALQVAIQCLAVELAKPPAQQNQNALRLYEQVLVELIRDPLGDFASLHYPAKVRQAWWQLSKLASKVFH